MAQQIRPEIISRLSSLDSFGDEITSTSNDREKFATYTRDSYTGLDYADQRYYASTYGRFNTPDPYQASGGPSDPGSWNRYSYVQGDPVNYFDPAGRERGIVGSCSDTVDGFVQAGCVGYGTDYDSNPLYSNCLQNCDLLYSPPDQWAPPELCPLVSIVGNYTPGAGSKKGGPVDPMFAPAMAYDIDAALAILNGEGITPTITSGFRTAAAQANAANGGSGSNPAAPVGQSWHEVGLAVDVQLTSANASAIIAAFTSVGLTWGGTFSKTLTSKPDPVHFQLPSAVNRGGVITSGAPSPGQVANCESEHPNGR